MENTIEITRTEIAMKVTCKCGGCIAATMIYGGIEIDAEFMDTVAKYANDGGKVEIINTTKDPVKLDGCLCVS